MDLREIGCGSVQSIELAPDRGRWRAVVTTVMYLRFLAPRIYLVTIYLFIYLFVFNDANTA
jgi:hypothetical protein